MIGSAAGLSFTDFITNTGVAVLFVLAATIVCFYFIYGRKLHVEPEAMDSILQLDENKAIKDRSLLIKSVVMILLVVFGFVFHSQLHLESCTIALTAAAVMLLIGRQDVEEIVAGVEWTTILFFTGLFIVVGGLQETGVIQILANGLMDLTEGHMTLTILLILWVSAIVSSFLDNIPFVATLIPPDPHHAEQRRGCHPPVVGGLPGRLPGRQRHPHRRLGQCGPFGHQQPPRVPHHLCQLL